MDYPISARRSDLIIINKKERTCKIVNFAVPADHRVKLKECEKMDIYLDLARELKKKNIIENGQNTEKSTGDLKILAVTQNPMKNHQLTLM